MLRPAGGGHHAVAQLREDRHGDGAHAAVGAGHQDVAVLGLHAAMFQRQHAQHGGVAGGADGHGVFAADAVGQLHQPLAGHSRALCQAAVVGLAEAVAVEHHALARVETGVAGVDHGAGQVDAGNHREAADDRRAVGHRQRVFVVQCGVVHLHQHIAVVQVRFVKSHQLGGYLAIVFAGQQGIEFHGRASPSGDMSCMLWSCRGCHKNYAFP
ncbi:hypothetical protein D9M72_539100 [compost metagenome]